MSGKRLPPRLEDYLETIAELCATHGHAHVSEIARARGVRMATVSEAIDALQRRGLVDHSDYAAARLTERGRKVAEKIRRRHAVLFRFFHELLGLPREVAEEEACALEHTVREETLRRMEELMQCVEECDRRGGGCKCLRRFRRMAAQDEEAAGEGGGR